MLFIHVKSGGIKVLDETLSFAINVGDWRPCLVKIHIGL